MKIFTQIAFASRKKLFQNSIAALFLLLVGQSAFGQVVISRQDFETTPATPTLTFAITNVGTPGSGTGYSTGTSGSSASPNSNMFSEGARGYRIAGETGPAGRVLTFATVNTTGYTGVSLSFRVAGMSIGSTANGMDNSGSPNESDKVLVEVSPDGGTTWYQQAKVVSGGTNLRWYFGATGAGSRAYAADNSLSTFTTTANVLSGSGNTAISTVTITGLPAITNLRVRITATADSANESWIIDDLRISGTEAPSVVAPTVSTTTASSITVNGASSGGNVTADGGATVTARGVVYNTATGPTILNSVVTTGSGTGSYTSALSSLAVNTRYYYRAYATNSAGTGYGNESNFYTLANTPGVLVRGTESSNSIELSFNTATQNSNPAITAYAIQETGSGLYVQVGGSLGASAVWQTPATWSTITVNGLANSTTYNFVAKARNGDLVETAFGGSVSGTTTGAVAPVVTPGSPTGTYNAAFNYQIIASNSPTSYALSSGTLPTGINLNTTSGVISGTPTQTGTFNVYFTATNPGGTSTPALIAITINTASQSITFGTLTAVTYGVAPFNLTGTASSGLTVSYASSNENVATVSGNTITVVGAGTATITASQAGDANYSAATNVPRTLTVNTKNLTITGLTANNKVQDGTTTATLSGTPNLNGIVSGDEANVSVSGTAVAAFASAAPATGIAVTVTGYTLSGSKASNYNLTQPAGLTANITALGLPTATAATAVLQNGFTANWSAVTGATSYLLNVYTIQNTPSPELLINGGFETGNLSDWTFESAMNQVASTVQVHSGTHSLYSTVTATKNFNQTISVVSGEEYTLGFWYYIDATSSGNGFRVWTTTGATIQLPTSSTYYNTKGSWQYVEQDFTASSNSLIFNMRLYNGVKLYLDDISIKLASSGPTITQIAGSPFTVSAPAISRNITGLDAETAYYYTVRSVNGSITSAISNEINVTTLPAPVTWNGSAWSNITGPTASLEAVIQGAYSTNNDTQNPNGFTAKKLTLSSGSFTINSGDNVTVVENVTNAMAAANFVVENNANLLQQGTANTNSGNITVKRNSATIKRLDYTLWSSPVTGQGLYAFSPFTFASRFYTYNSANDQYAAFGGFDISGLNTDGVNGTDNNNVPFATATGYLIRTPWNHPTAPFSYAGTFTGVPHSGDISLINLTSGRYYATGNPYPSTIDADQFIIDNNIGDDPQTPGDGLYFWRKTNNANQTTNPSSSYATYTTAGGVQSGGDSLNIVPSGIIQVGEGFLVKTTSTSLVFNNNQRVANNDNQFLRTAAIERNRIWLNLSDSAANVNQMMIAYMTDATQNIDPKIDARYINDSPTALNNLLDNQEFAIQGRSLPFTASDIVPLAFKAANPGNYSIAIARVDGLFAGGNQKVYLKDNLTSTVHDLSSGAYTFASATGTFNTRFEIIYQAQLSTPSFNANSVVVYSQDNGFAINSGNAVMQSVKVFDIRGRLLLEKNNIDSSQTVVSAGNSNQVLLIQITSEDNVTVTKKVIR